MNYPQFRYIYPPRPQLFIAERLPVYEQQGWWAQFKLNGTRTLLAVPPVGNIQWWDRHGKPQKAYKPNADMLASLQRLRGPRWRVYDAELLHNKSRFCKHVLVLFDILVDDGDYLFQTHYRQRYARLEAICGQGGLGTLGDEITPNLWLARNHDKDFVRLFGRAGGIIEGLVLKSPDRPLAYHYNSDGCDWMAKVRIPAANYKR